MYVYVMCVWMCDVLTLFVPIICVDECICPIKYTSSEPPPYVAGLCKGLGMVDQPPCLCSQTNETNCTVSTCTCMYVCVPLYVCMLVVDNLKYCIA